MESKFQSISKFIEKLEKTNSINDEEQALLLIGGNGIAVKTNAPCSNDDCINSPCINSTCGNPACANAGCTNSGCK